MFFASNGYTDYGDFSSCFQYVFTLKYPEKEDFKEELESGEIDPHKEEFYLFFNSLKNYMTDICNKFVLYSKDTSEFANVSSSVDMESLAQYAVIDQAFREGDHNQKSYKMYREMGVFLNLDLTGIMIHVRMGFHILKHMF